VSERREGEFIIAPDDRILVTGATGFIGSRLVENLINRGFRNLVCLVRPSSERARLDDLASRRPGASIEIVAGNLQSREDCARAMEDVAVVFHLVAGGGEKAFPDAVMNAVVTTRNLLEAAAGRPSLRRFVHVSSFTVYSNRSNPHGRVLDERGPVEGQPALRGEAYCFAKVKQEEIVREYGARHRLPYVIVRPGAVYGPGQVDISGRVGVGTFGVFLHLGGRNTIPFTYVDNCADAIALAGLRSGIEGEVFNVVDDDLPTSRQFLRLYKRCVRPLVSVYVPSLVGYVLCYAWERYSAWSQGQLPPVYNRRRWHAYWKGARYSNAKLKARVGWAPAVPTAEGLRRYFQDCRERRRHA